MLLLGDVLAIVALFAAAAVASWATLLAVALLFPVRTTRTAELLESHPGRCIGLGLPVAVFLILLGLGMAGAAPPVVKLVGFALLVYWLGFASVGAAGLVRLIAARIRGEDPHVPALPSLVRGSLYLVFAGLMPFVGTFFILPLVLAAGTGSALFAMFRRTSAVEAV